MRNTLRLTVLFALLTLMLVACGEDDGTTEATFDIGGPCVECPAERLDSILKETEGVLSHDYNKESGELKVTYDSLKLKRQALIMVITGAGYDAGVEFGLDHPGLACCKQGTNVLSLDIDDDEESMMEAEIEESIEEEFDDLEDMESDITDDMEDFNIDIEEMGDEEIEFQEDPELMDFEDEPLYKRLGDVDEDPKKKK